jgi:hypothetical protein
MRIPDSAILDSPLPKGKPPGAALSVVLLLILAMDQIAAQDASPSDFDWLSSARIFILDGYTYPLYPKIRFDAEKLANTMLDMHADTLRVATSGNYYLIGGTQFQTAPDLGDRDILAECVAACKPRRIRVVPYIRTGGGLAAETVKPEWAYRVNPRGDIPVRWDLGARRSALCWNTAYRQAFYDLIDKVVSRYDIDGIYFDAWKIFYRFEHPNVCYCTGCRKGFAEATDLELPYRENPGQYTTQERKTIRRYQDWYGEELVKVFHETKRIIRSHKDIPLIFNLNHARNIRNPSFTDPRIVDESDAFLYEMSKSMLERAEGISLAVAHGLAVWPYVDAYHGYGRIGVNSYEIHQHICATVAFGGSPILYHTYFFANHPEARKPVRKAFAVFDENRRYVEGFEPLKFCAVVWNDEDPPGHASDGWLWDTNARLCTSGAFAACMHGHVQTTAFLKEDLNNLELLKQYKVLYLPDICLLSERQIATIKRFVATGGGLVMTYATSLYDEHGKKRPDFALGDLARIRYVNPDERLRDKMAANLCFGGVWDLYLKARNAQQVIVSHLANDLMPTFVYQPVKVLPGATVAADIVVGTDSEPIFPGLIVAKHGKGKVAYISAALDAMYMQTHIRQFRDFIRNVVEYVSPEPPPYEIDAPSSLTANMTEHGNTRVLHMVNWTGCKLEQPQQKVYHIPPIEDVTIRYRIPPGKSVRKVSLFVPAAFGRTHKKDTLQITLPRIEDYQAVVFKME